MPKTTELDRSKLRKVANLGLEIAVEVLEKVQRGSNLSDDERMAMEAGLRAAGTEARLYAGETNRMAIELAIARHTAESPPALPRQSEAA